MAQNLYEFYTGQGKALPSIQERQSVAKEAGIANYSGTAQQNQQLLGFLQSPSRQPVAPIPQQNTAITPEKLAPVVPIEQPTTPPPAIPQSQNIADQILQQIEVAPTEAQQFQENTIQNIVKNMGLLQGEAADKALALEQAGVSTLKQDLQNINSQILKKQAEIQQDDVQLIAQMRAEERRDTLLPFAQMGQAKLAGDAQIMRALKTSEIGVLNASAIAKQGDIQLAKETAQEAVDAKYAPYKQQIELGKAYLEAIQPLLSRDEKKQAREQNLRADLAMREIDKAETNEKEAKNLALTLAQNQAPSSIINSALASKSIEEMLKIPGVEKYLMSPMEKLQLQKINLDIRNSNLEYANLVAEANKAKAYLEGTTGDPVLDIISASAQYGDKRLTDSQLEKIQKANDALGSLESLQGLLSIDATGPVKGRARTLISQLGGDADARAINATIQGLIPTVARGIFGEVGVLTDADINNYKKTIPNLNSTEAQNKLVSLVMYDVLSRSLKTTLTTNAQNQTNVSNFASTYSNIEKRISVLKNELGATESAPISQANRVKMESTWNSSSFGANNISSRLNSLLDN